MKTNTKRSRRSVSSFTFEPVQPLEARLLMASAIRSYDGSGNNLLHPTWGQTGTALQRVAPPAYGDMISTPAGADRPSARDISNIIFQQHHSEDIFNQEGMSAFVYAWGQFIDHDLDLTNNASPPTAFNIPVPQGDPSFDPNWTGTQVISLNRSQWVTGTGTSTSNPRQQPNSVTAFIDGSMIYGSDPVRAAALRTFHDGLMKTTANGTELPYNTLGLENQDAGPPDQFFLAGDVRANENAELTSLQVLFVREHNRLAGVIKQQNRRWSDEQIYQQARRLVIGEIQQITYNEFLPSFLKKNAVPAYTGYKPNVNAQIASEFSTAAFRFGHSILGDDVQFFDDDAQITLPDLKLTDTFFAPQLQLNGGTDGLLKYLAAVSAQESDPLMVNSIRNFLFGPPGAGGFDLSALDVQRGRDHGLADYNTVRASLGLPRITSFDQITSNHSLALTLQATYGSVDNVDLFVGGMVENHAPGAAVGETFQAIIANQFTRTRDGDRFWYQRDLSPAEQRFIQPLTLSQIIKKNSTITNLQPDAFHFDVYVSGKVFNDINGNGRMDRNEQPVANTFVYISDEGGIFDWSQTDSQGNYKLNRIQVGDYGLSVDLPDGWVQTTTNTLSSIHVNKDVHFANVNWGVRFVGGGTTGGTSASGISGLTGFTGGGIDAGNVVDGKIFGDSLI